MCCKLHHFTVTTNYGSLALKKTTKGRKRLAKVLPSCCGKRTRLLRLLFLCTRYTEPQALIENEAKSLCKRWTSNQHPPSLRLSEEGEEYNGDLWSFLPFLKPNVNLRNDCGMRKGRSDTSEGLWLALPIPPLLIPCPLPAPLAWSWELAGSCRSWILLCDWAQMTWCN